MERKIIGYYIGLAWETLIAEWRGSLSREAIGEAVPLSTV